MATATQGTILYEVDLSVSPDKSSAYLTWLDKFIAETMLKLDGFLSAEVFTVDHIDKVWSHLLGLS